MKKRSKRTKQETNILQNKYMILGVLGTFFTILGFALDKIAIRLMNMMTFETMNFIFIMITTLGESYVFLLISLILAAMIFINRKPVMAFILSLAAAFLVQWLLKMIIHRPRPFEVGLTSTNIAATSNSFPSGHTLMFFALIPTVGKKFPRARPLLWVIAILVGFSRIYLGVHYLSDVIAGAFIGYIIGMLFMDIESRYRWDT